MWRFVVIHSLQQVHVVMTVLGKHCNAGVETGIWDKSNIHETPSGNRLSWSFENWTIGYYHESGIRTRDLYNFEPAESRRNVLTFPCVTAKGLTPLGDLVNPYQKPVGLMDYFVRHFSLKGDCGFVRRDWVYYLCCPSKQP